MAARGRFVTVIISEALNKRTESNSTEVVIPSVYMRRH